MPKHIAKVLVFHLAAICTSVCLAQNEDATAEEPQKPDNSAALDALVRLTRDQDATVRMTAFGAIAQIGQETPAVVAAVQSGLKDDDLRVRVESFFALTKAVQDGKVTVDALLMLIQDEDEQLAVKAAEQLGKLGKSAVPHLVEALKNEKTRVLIVRTLGSLGGNARDSIPALTELLKSDDASLRALVASCLGQICGPQQQSRPSANFYSRSSRSRGPDSASIQRLLDAVWPRYDTNGDGKLSPVEQTSLRTLDASADTDGDKHVSRDEFAVWYLAKFRERNSDRDGVPRSSIPAFGRPPDGR